MRTTVGDLNASMIGRTRLNLQHEGTTVSGRLMHLGIKTDTITAAIQQRAHRWET